MHSKDRVAPTVDWLPSSIKSPKKDEAKVAQVLYHELVAKRKKCILVFRSAKGLL